MANAKTIDAVTLANLVMDGTIQLSADDKNQVALAKAKKLTANKADCKAHLAKLEEAADDEEDEEKAKKLRKSAKKLKAKMAESEDEEVDLSIYPIDTAALSDSDEVKKLKAHLNQVTTQMAELQQNVVKLSAGVAPTKDELVAKLAQSVEASNAILAALKGVA